MKKTSLLICLVLLGVAFALTACGGDDGDDNGTNIGPSGLDRNKLLSDLTSEERTLICDWKQNLLIGEFQDKGCAETTEDEKTFSETVVTRCADDDYNFSDCSISLLEDCALAMFADICSDEVPAACTLMQTCLDEQTPPGNRYPNCSPPCSDPECSGIGWCF